MKQKTITNKHREEMKQMMREKAKAAVQSSAPTSTISQMATPQSK